VTEPAQIYLHIGVPKTGTSALQEVGHVFRDLLAREGICYPRTPGLRNHVLLAVYASDNASNSTSLPRLVSLLAGRRALGESSPPDPGTATPPANELKTVVDLFDDESYLEFRQSFPELLRSEIVGSGCQKVVLSNEQLSWQLKTPDEVQRLADLLRPISDDIRVVVYLRRQDELALSLHSMSIKQGYRHVNLKLGPRNSNYNYAQMLKPWARVFGKEALIVKVYEKDRLRHGDLVSDFASIVGYERDESIRFPSQRGGRRLDAVTSKFLREFNRHVPTFRGSEWNPLRDHIGDTLELISSESDPVGWAGEPLDQVLAKFAESNAEVAREYLGREDGKLFSDSPVPDYESEAKLPVQKAIEIAAHLWVSKQAEVIKLQERLRHAHSQMDQLARRVQKSDETIARFTREVQRSDQSKARFAHQVREGDESVPS
jgi:hypothetical protein